jgi:leader peptidase (prepilin peptidase)/N-methyltransferase
MNVVMTCIYVVIFFLFGSAIGSFINVVADRLPRGQSIVAPGSYCVECKHNLAPKDLVPLFSYLWLRGRCRYCGAAVPIRLFLIELTTAILFVFLYYYYGISWELAIAIFSSGIFISLLIIDLEHGILPNIIIVVGIAVVIIYIVIGTILGYEPEFISNIGFNLWIVDAVVGSGIGFILLFLVALIFRGGMGWGDVKLSALLGLIVGFPLIFIALWLAIIFGGVIAGILLLTRVKSRKDSIPFGPFLAVAGIVTVLWGKHILLWLIAVF